MIPRKAIPRFAFLGNAPSIIPYLYQPVVFSAGGEPLVQRLAQASSWWFLGNILHFCLLWFWWGSPPLTCQEVKLLLPFQGQGPGFLWLERVQFSFSASRWSFLVRGSWATSLGFPWRSVLRERFLSPATWHEASKLGPGFPGFQVRVESRIL